MARASTPDPLDVFQPAVCEWFRGAFGDATPPQVRGWPVIARGEHALIVSPTGTGKTLAAFLWAIDRVMFAPLPATRDRCRVLYISPLKALAVDVERNLRAPLAGITQRRAAAGRRLRRARRRGADGRHAGHRARALPARARPTSSSRRPSRCSCCSRRARATCSRSVETVIVDEIHALVPDQARRAPRAVARTTGGTHGAAAAADRSFRYATSARRGRAIPGWRAASRFAAPPPASGAPQTRCGASDCVPPRRASSTTNLRARTWRPPGGQSPSSMRGAQEARPYR